MDKVSEYVKQQREARNITLEELSNATLISIVTLKDIEAGKFDKYKGDELYIKMYLKKIANFLELDTNEIDQLVNNYVALTQEIALQDIQKMQEQQRLQEENRKNIKVVDKLGETFREVKLTSASTITKRRRKHVYEDNFIKRYIKYGVVIVLLAAIVFVVWFSMVAGKSDSVDNYTKPQTPDVEENSDATKDNSQKQEDTKKEDEKKDENTPDVAITNIEGSSYNVGLKAGDTFTLEVTFGAQSTFNLWRGSTSVEGAYKVYEANETYVYETQITGNETYYLNIWNLEGAVIKINGKVLEYDPASVSKIQGDVWNFILYMKGE